MPPEIITPQAIDEVMNLLSENEIEVIDSAKRPKESDDEEEGEELPLVPGAAVVADEAGEEAPVASRHRPRGRPREALS